MNTSLRHGLFRILGHDRPFRHRAMEDFHHDLLFCILVQITGLQGSSSFSQMAEERWQRVRKRLLACHHPVVQRSLFAPFRYLEEVQMRVDKY